MEGECALGHELLDERKKNIVWEKGAKDLKRFQCLGTWPAASNLVKVNFLVNVSVQLRG